MKKFLSLIWLLSFIIISSKSYSQYSISGYINAPDKNKRVYLSLLKYDEQSGINENQVITSTLSDSTGYFSFTGKLLSNKHKLYRIHANLKERSEGLDLANGGNEIRKNFHNFIFSNTDTIVFKKAKSSWFAASFNTNTADREWRKTQDYIKKLYKEFSGTKNTEVKTQSSFQFFSELKLYFKKTRVHPLVKLVLLYGIPESILKKDFQNDSEFYLKLQSDLDNYFSNRSYALQFQELVSSISVATMQQQLISYKRTIYLLSFVVLILILCIVFLVIRVNKKPKIVENESINLTSQEEKIAELIIEEKSNKEIASELFISLNTVKTHIRNLYAKLEVSNRQEFTEKMKKSP